MRRTLVAHRRAFAWTAVALVVSLAFAGLFGHSHGRPRPNGAPTIEVDGHCIACVLLSSERPPLAQVSDPPVLGVAERAVRVGATVPHALALVFPATLRGPPSLSFS